MDDDNEEATAGKDEHRVTVVFNARDMSRITAEVARRTKKHGYTVHRADALRELVRDNWPVPG